MPEQENALVTTGPAGVPSPTYVLPGLSLPVQVVEFLTSLIAGCNRRISLQLATFPEVGDSSFRSDSDLVIHGGSNSLRAAKIAFGSLDREMAEEKLNLL
jgi:hypothetical protein